MWRVEGGRLKVVVMTADLKVVVMVVGLKVVVVVVAGLGGGD